MAKVVKSEMDQAEAARSRNLLNRRRMDRWNETAGRHACRTRMEQLAVSSGRIKSLLSDFSAVVMMLYIVGTYVRTYNHRSSQWHF